MVGFNEQSGPVVDNQCFQNFLLNKMANAVLTEVLSEIGWDRKFALPMSNAENKAVEDEVREEKKNLAEHKLNIKVCAE